ILVRWLSSTLQRTDTRPRMSRVPARRCGGGRSRDGKAARGTTRATGPMGRVPATVGRAGQGRARVPAQVRVKVGLGLGVVGLGCQVEGEDLDVGVGAVQVLNEGREACEGSHTR